MLILEKLTEQKHMVHSLSIYLITVNQNPLSNGEQILTLTGDCTVYSNFCNDSTDHLVEG